MNRLVEEIIKPILEANPQIKKVVGVYGGRFQPFGPHHYKTYKWLAKQVDDAYITTSNIKKPPRHPMNFKEKVRHMSKMGVPSNRIIEEKSPYKAVNLAKKYNSDTTAFVYVFGEKDAGRLGGGGKYFQDYKKNIKNLKGYEENGYYLTAPHISISVGGKEVSGTSMRELLGSSKIDDSERAKLFKDMFGYYDKGVFNMITNKFKKLFEVNESLPNKVSDKYKKVKPGDPKDKKKFKQFIDHHKYHSGPHITGQEAEPETYDFDDSDDSKPGVQKRKKDKIKKGYEPVKETNNKKLKKLKPKFKDGKGKELIKGQMKENVSSSQLAQVEKYLDRLWGKVGVDIEFTRHFMDRVNDTRNDKPINSAEVMRIFKQTFKKYGKQIPKLGKDAEALMKDMKTDVNVPFVLKWDGKEFDLIAKTIMRKKNFKSSNKKFAVEGKLEESKKEFVIWGIPPNKSSEEILYTKAKSQGEAKKVVKVLTDKHGIKKARIQILDLEQDPSKFWNSQDMYEGVDLPIEIGDTVLMGKFKNKKVVIKTISWNEKGDLLINGKSSMRMRIPKKPNVFDEDTIGGGYPDKEGMKKIKKRVNKARSQSDSNKEYQYDKIAEFLTTIDMKEIIDEVTTATGQGKGIVDDGPSAMMGGKAGYFGRNKEWAEKLGWEVVNYILDVDVSDVPPFKGEFGGGKSVSYLPAGIGTGGTPNNPDNLSGTKGYNKWVKNMKKIAQEVGFKLIKFKDEKETKKQIAKDTTATLKQQKSDEKDIKDIKVEESVLTKEWWKNLIIEDLLTEGGAYGHMAHPFDDNDLTFGDLKKIIEDGLGGTLNREDNVTEKLDGQNIMISWKDGKLIAARNKGHIKNGGKTALTKSGIKSKFEGRGDIANAFNFAMNDLEKAIKGLSDKQKEKIFNNGYNFMNMEVMWPSSANVIDYDVATLVFHGALKYDDSGTVKGEVKGSARILAGMIKQVNKHIGKKYSIGKPNFLDVPKNQDFGKLKGKFIGELNTLKNQYALKDSDTLGLYHQSYWEEYIFNAAQQFGYEITDDILENLTKRWAFFDKSYKIATIKKDLKEESEFLEWVLSTDKDDHKKIVKENMKPFEVLFFAVGAEILKNVKGFMAVNPDKAVQGIKKRIDKAISDVKGGKDLKKLNTLKLQLDKLNAIGGIDSIVPSEGIVFKYKGNTYKFTGAFAPVNQITGLISF